MSRGPGYIIVSRDIFEHSLFKRLFAHRAYSRLEAWLWLMGRAAWCSRGHDTPYGTVDNVRAELSYTEREIAAAWHWSQPRVHRWLAKLTAEGMIRVEMRRCGSESGSEIVSKSGYERSVITICNYNAIQGAEKKGSNRADQKLNQGASQNPTLFGWTDSGKPRRSNSKQVNQRAKEASERAKPRHRAHIKVGGRGKEFFDYQSDEWNLYAAHLAERGVAVLPTRYVDGLGKWFWLDGAVDAAPKRRAR